MNTLAISQKCPKCKGSGNLNWTDNDGGVCYKCEGKGYIGEMPEGFDKKEKELKDAAKKLIEAALYNDDVKNGKTHYKNYIFYPATIKELVSKGKVYKLGYTKFWMNVPDTILNIPTDNTKTSGYTVTIGEEFIIIKPYIN